MASLIFKERKGMNFSCTSPASTAVCTSIDRRSIIQPISTRYLHQSKATPSAAKSILPPLPPPPTKQRTAIKHHKQKSSNVARRRSSDIITVSAEKISPPVSSRYLLNNGEGVSDAYTEPESVHTPGLPSLLIMGPPQASAEISEESAKQIVTVESKSPTHVDKPRDQVVELRVSLHCKGCQAKVKKHLSKMEGVTSFSIDFATKKVTVVGDVTPLGVLNSISKVKNAQFWPTPPSLSSPKFAS